MCVCVYYRASRRRCRRYRYAIATLSLRYRYAIATLSLRYALESVCYYTSTLMACSAHRARLKEAARKVVQNALYSVSHGDDLTLIRTASDSVSHISAALQTATQHFSGTIYLRYFSWHYNAFLLFLHYRANKAQKHSVPPRLYTGRFRILFAINKLTKAEVNIPLYTVYVPKKYPRIYEETRRSCETSGPN